MATANDEVLCVICDSNQNTSKCGECFRHFCSSHLKNHYRELNERLMDIKQDCSIFRQSLNQQRAADNVLLLNQVDEWELNGISKIRETAEQTRATLLKSKSEYIDAIEKECNQLDNKLTKTSSEVPNDTSLYLLEEELKRLKRRLVLLSNLSIQEDPTKFINKIYVDISDAMSSVQAKPTITSEKIKWQAHAAMYEKKYSLAKELFSHALEHVPEYAPYLTGRAQCCCHLNDAEKALKDSSMSIKADPLWPDGYLYKGKALEMLNRKKEAIDCYRRLCQLEPNQEKYKYAFRQCSETSSPSSELGKKDDETAIHSIKCDACVCYPITGIRYMCVICHEYNLCAKCLSSNPNHKRHTGDHPLVSVKQSEQFSQLSSNLLRAEARALLFEVQATSRQSRHQYRRGYPILTLIHILINSTVS
ncbi:unnamed protein product [Rotaria sp. Silwood2]|nr:unnamed protein product [Rotaria sp. Silwood2]